MGTFLEGEHVAHACSAASVHLCLVCIFMLQYSLTLLKEFILDGNFHYVAPDFVFCHTE